MTGLQVNFTIQGVNRVRNQLRTIASMHPKLTDPVIEKHVKWQAAQFRSKAYPPKLPNQKYKRTYELRRKFRAQHIKAGVWRIINRRKGAVWVIKKGFQNRKYHAGRWWTIEDVSQENMPKLTKALSAELEKKLDRA